MSIFNKIKLVLVSVALFLCIILVIQENRKEEIRHKKLVSSIAILVASANEKAFAEGQVHAINGDVRIKKINDSTYIWIKSPWDSGMKPINDTLIIK